MRPISCSLLIRLVCAACLLSHCAGVRAEEEPAAPGSAEATKKKLKPKEVKIPYALADKYYQVILLGPGTLGKQSFDIQAVAKTKALVFFDKDKDGALSEEEIANANEFLDNVLAKIDTDGDGKLSDEEKAAAAAKVDAVNAARNKKPAADPIKIPKFATDTPATQGTGTPEPAARSDADDPKAAEAKFREHVMALVDKADKNLDGKISPAERADLAKMLEGEKFPDMQKVMDQCIKKYEANH